MTTVFGASRTGTTASWSTRTGTVATSYNSPISTYGGVSIGSLANIPISATSDGTLLIGSGTAFLAEVLPGNTVRFNASTATISVVSADNLLNLAAPSNIVGSYSFDLQIPTSNWIAKSGTVISSYLATIAAFGATQIGSLGSYPISATVDGTFLLGIGTTFVADVVAGDLLRVGSVAFTAASVVSNTLVVPSVKLPFVGSYGYDVWSTSMLLPAPTASATGTLPDGGTETSVIDAITCAGVVRVSIKSVDTLTVGAVSSGSSGVVTVTGQGSATVDAVAGSASVMHDLLSAVVSAPIGSIGLSISTNNPCTAAGSSTVSALVSSSAGGVQIAGVGSAAVAVPTTSGAGGAQVNSVGSATVGAISGSAVVRPNATGGGSGVVGPVGIASAGLNKIGITFSATLDTVVGGGVASDPISEAASIQMATISVASTATVAVVGSGSGLIETVVSTVAPKVLVVASAAGTVSAISSNAVAVDPINGVGSTTISAIQAVAVSYNPSTGAESAAIPSITAAIVGGPKVSSIATPAIATFASSAVVQVLDLIAANDNLPAVTCSSSGTTKISGSMVQSIGSVSGSLVSSDPVSTQEAGAVGTITSTSAGAVKVGAAGTATIIPFPASAIVRLPVSGAGIVNLDQFTPAVPVHIEEVGQATDPIGEVSGTASTAVIIKLEVRAKVDEIGDRATLEHHYNPAALWIGI